jgi:hypothetical protein
VQSAARLLIGNARCDRSRYRRGNSCNFFIIFVDAIFTTLLEPLFTNALDMIDAKSTEHCVWRARHAD